MLKMFDCCPGCGGPLVITECKCTRCQLELRGEFVPGQFAVLSDDQLTFVRGFLRVRGNLSEMEKLLGVSYPTIRNKLDEVNQALDRAETRPQPSPATASPEPEAGPVPPDERRRAILRQVAAGDLPPAEGLEKLKNLKGETP
jgi:hypothetical protein